MNEKILGLILARGGSKRLPGKNVKMLDGKPLIAYTIDCAKKSKYINRIIVTTDDFMIANISRLHGAEIPFLRPSHLAKDDSLEIDVIKHALTWLKKNEDYEPDLVVKLFPTSPFRKTETVDKAIEMMLSNQGADSVRSVRYCKEHPYKMWLMNDKWLNHFVPEGTENYGSVSKLANSHTFAYQNLPKVYVQNASFDVIRPSNIFDLNSITGDMILPIVMDEEESIDINTPLDFDVAEMVLKRKQKTSE